MAPSQPARTKPPPFRSVDVTIRPDTAAIEMKLPRLSTPAAAAAATATVLTAPVSAPIVASAAVAATTTPATTAISATVAALLAVLATTVIPAIPATVVAAISAADAAAAGMSIASKGTPTARMTAVGWFFKDLTDCFTRLKMDGESGLLHLYGHPGPNLWS